MYRLIFSNDQQLNIDQIKARPIFYGVDWMSIRQIDVPFIPHLRSITYTPSFPTNGLQQVPDELTNTETGAEQEFGIPWIFFKHFTTSSRIFESIYLVV